MLPHLLLDACLAQQQDLSLEFQGSGFEAFAVNYKEIAAGLEARLLFHRCKRHVHSLQDLTVLNMPQLVQQMCCTCCDTALPCLVAREQQLAQRLGQHDQLQPAVAASKLLLQRNCACSFTHLAD